MPDTHRMHLPRRTAAAALAPWLLAARLGARCFRLTLPSVFSGDAPVPPS